MRKFFVFVMVILAIIVAVLGVSLPRDHLQPIVVITNFFDVMIPILAVAALLVYLCKAVCCNSHHHDE